MNNAEFENRMFDHVNKNYQMKELNRQEVERAAWEEYQYIRKCRKVSAVIGIIVWVAIFIAILLSMVVLTLLGHIHFGASIVVMALVGYAVGMITNALYNKTKN